MSLLTPSGLSSWSAPLWLISGAAQVCSFAAERAVSAESRIPRKARVSSFRLRTEVSDGQGLRGPGPRKGLRPLTRFLSFTLRRSLYVHDS